MVEVFGLKLLQIVCVGQIEVPLRLYVRQKRQQLCDVCWCLNVQVLAPESIAPLGDLFVSEWRRLRLAAVLEQCEQRLASEG